MRFIVWAFVPVECGWLHSSSYWESNRAPRLGASLSSHEEAHWIGRDDNVGQRGLGLLGFGLASDAEALEFGAIMMKRTVAWAADNTRETRCPTELKKTFACRTGGTNA
jgi:hypothetical protein